MPDSYTLNRDSVESQRLNKQHELYKINTGHLLHPRIAATLPKDAHIAEVATGTGIWLRDLSSQFPKSWSFTGLDISADQFPKQHEDRLELKVLNILNPVPEEYKGTIDVVHLRLLVCGLSGDDWKTAARNIHNLLKPESWIQWQESDFANMRALQSTPGGSIAATQSLMDFNVAVLAKEGRLLSSDVYNLRNVISEAGFGMVEQDVFSSDRVPETRELANQIEIGALVALGGYCARTYPEMGWTVEKVEEVEEKMRAELEGGRAYSRWDMFVVTGRKGQ